MRDALSQPGTQAFSTTNFITPYPAACDFDRSQERPISVSRRPTSADFFFPQKQTPRTVSRAGRCQSGGRWEQEETPFPPVPILT
jgi:hypothetical protein